MELRDLIGALEAPMLMGADNVDITNIQSDSRRVFVCRCERYGRGWPCLYGQRHREGSCRYRMRGGSVLFGGEMLVYRGEGFGGGVGSFGFPLVW